MSDKEKQLKKEEAEKVSGGHFEPMYGGIGPDSYESKVESNFLPAYLKHNKQDEDVETYQPDLTKIP